MQRSEERGREDRKERRKKDEETKSEVMRNANACARGKEIFDIATSNQITKRFIFTSSIARIYEIDRTDVEESILVCKGRINGAQANICSVPESRDVTNSSCKHRASAQRSCHITVIPEEITLKTRCSNT